MNELKLKMEWVRSTKGTEVYVNNNAAITTLYIQKNAIDKEVPKNITVTVSND